MQNTWLQVSSYFDFLFSFDQASLSIQNYNYDKLSRHLGREFKTDFYYLVSLFVTSTNLSPSLPL